MKTTTVSKRFIALLCCIAVCIALIATALGFDLTSRAQAEDAQENGIELFEEEPTGDIQIIEEEIDGIPEDITGEGVNQAGETAVTEETQTPAEEPASGEPEDAEPAGSEESAEPDLTGTEATGETVDAEEAEPEDIDAIAEEGDTNAIDADAEDATSEDDYGIMLLANEIASGKFGADGDNLEWVLDDEGVLTISGEGAMEDWPVDYPGWYAYRDSMISVVIEDGVANIGDYAFFNCTALTSISISDSVTSIGEFTFSYCENLANVEFPTSLDSIGDYAFSNCITLTDISIPEGVNSIGAGTFQHCENLASVKLPTSLDSIGDRVFYDCYALTGISIPEGVTSIGEDAFNYCINLVSVELPNTLTSIGGYAFWYCYALTDISIPDNVTSIGDYAFWYCTDLTGISIPEGITTIGEGTFGHCESLASVDLPTTLTSLGNNAFYDCTSLTAISIPDNVTYIGDWAFWYCPLNGDSMIDTTTVNAGAEVYSITSGDTTYTTQTTPYTGHTLTLPESLTSVGAYAFANTSVDYFVIGSSLTSITGNAFASNSLKAIIFDNSADQVTVENDDYASIADNTNNYVSLVYRDGENGFELSLTKEAKGSYDFDTFEFEITLTQQDGTPFSGELDADGTEEVVSFTDGEATVEIASGDTLTLLWVPENMEWSIVELTEAEETAISVNGSEAAEAKGILTEDTAVTFTNYYKIGITVSIVWDDADDADGIRPDSIEVQLLADDEEIDTQTLSEENGWSYTWENLDVYADGNEIEYMVGEVEVDGYEASADVTDNGDGTYSVTITNTHTPEGEIPAPTTTVDVGAGTDVAPGESFTYTIEYTNGDEDGATITITDVLDEGLDFVSATEGGVYDEATRTITWVITDVAAGATGSVSFTVVVNEKALSNGEVSNSATVQINDGPAVSTNTVTNPVKAASTVTFDVVKVWDDNNDLYGARPDLIVVVLLQNGQATALTQLLSAENSWTGTFSDLPEYDANGEKIVYSIAEVTVANYTSVITGDQDSGFTVTNTYDFDKITSPEPGTPNTGNPDNGNPQPVPQTGQDSLPIAPLAITGTVIVAAGVALLVVRRRRAA